MTYQFALGAVLAAVSTCADASALPVPVSALEPALRAGEVVQLPGGASFKVTSVDDERCRPADHCSPAERERRTASAEPALTSADGRLYQPGHLVVAREDQRHAKLADWLVELLDVVPPGRALPADGPSRQQQAQWRLTPADRASIGAGVGMALPRAAFTLRVVSIDDRRCPQGVYCASPGTLQVVAEVAAGSGAPKRLNFGALSPQAHQWQGFDIQLCDVRPRVGPDGSTPSPALADFFVSPSRGPLSSADLHGHSCAPAAPR
jgi:hypothetical protein